MPDEGTRNNIYRWCVASLDDSWCKAIGEYMACTSCEQVRLQVACLLRACNSDPDGELSKRGLIDHCADTVLAGAALAR